MAVMSPGDRCILSAQSTAHNRVFVAPLCTSIRTQVSAPNRLNKRLVGAIGWQVPIRLWLGASQADRSCCPYLLTRLMANSHNLICNGNGLTCIGAVQQCIVCTRHAPTMQPSRMAALVRIGRQLGGQAARHHSAFEVNALKAGGSHGKAAVRNVNVHSSHHSAENELYKVGGVRRHFAAATQLHKAQTGDNAGQDGEPGWMRGLGLKTLVLASAAAIAGIGSSVAMADAHPKDQAKGPSVEKEKPKGGTPEEPVKVTRLIRELFEEPLLFPGTANVPLAKGIAEALNMHLSRISVVRFADGEKHISLLDSVRGRDCFVIQPTSPPVNESIMELFLIVSTMRRASAKSITAVIPYYGYARQDRKSKPRVPISAADVAYLLEAVGVDRVISVDLHCGQIQGFFSPKTPVDNLFGSVVAYPYFHKLKDIENAVVVSPDAGGVDRAKAFRDGLMKQGMNNVAFAMIIKQREKANEVSSMDLVGSVQGMDAIIVDDMIDTAGTLCKAAELLKSMGARRVYAFATHPVFSRNAMERIQASHGLDGVVVLNTIHHKEEDLAKAPKIKVLDIAPLLADAIRRISTHESISVLFYSEAEAEETLG
eukprot:jgi/Mesvir1/11497/Mv13851-RA.1